MEELWRWLPSNFSIVLASFEATKGNVHRPSEGGIKGEQRGTELEGWALLRTTDTSPAYLPASHSFIISVDKTEADGPRLAVQTHTTGMRTAAAEAARVGAVLTAF